MSERKYHHYCTVARALELVGGRWTLLLVRELLTGPKRFKDLQHGLPGIGTNLLAARLKELEHNGVVRRATLPPPAGSAVYELTEFGAGLGDAIQALSQWGIKLLGPARKTDFFRPSWAVQGLRASFRPKAARGVRETYEFRIDGEIFHVTVDDGRSTATQGPAAAPDLVITASSPDLIEMALGVTAPADAVASGTIQIQGSDETLDRCVRIFGLPRPVRGPAAAAAVPGRRS